MNKIIIFAAIAILAIFAASTAFQVFSGDNLQEELEKTYGCALVLDTEHMTKTEVGKLNSYLMNVRKTDSGYSIPETKNKFFIVGNGEGTTIFYIKKNLKNEWAVFDNWHHRATVGDVLTKIAQEKPDAIFIPKAT